MSAITQMSLVGVELERLHHQLAGVGGGAPVDAAEGIAGGVVADTAGVRRDVVGAATEAPLAGEAGGGRLEARQVDHARVHQDLLAHAVVALGVEEAEGIAAAHAQGTPVEKATAEEGGVDDPAPQPPPGNDHRPPGVVAGKAAGVLKLDPELGDETAVANLDELLRVLAHLPAQRAPVDAHVEGAGVEPGEPDGHGNTHREDVGDPVEQPEARAGGDEHSRHEDDDEHRECAPRRREGPREHSPHGPDPLDARARAGHGDAGEAVGHDVGGGGALDTRSRADDDAVPEGHEGQFLHVVGSDVVAPLQEGAGL